MLIKKTDVSDHGARMTTDYHFEDFTEKKYRQILKVAHKNYICIPFSGYANCQKTLLLRHDIDFSVHRAYKIATIESEQNMQSTFFLWIHSPFYNLFEDEIFGLIHKIIDLGHDIGLHFDCGFYNSYIQNTDFLENLAYERRILEHFFGERVRAFSFHNPTDAILSEYQEDQYSGMVNAYSKYIRLHFEYCSDSNGYWRFQRLPDLIRQAKSGNLQILTHPEWWTPGVLSPRERITRCIEGRGRKQHKWYDDELKKIGRINVD